MIIPCAPRKYFQVFPHSGGGRGGGVFLSAKKYASVPPRLKNATLNLGGKCLQNCYPNFIAVARGAPRGHAPPPNPPLFYVLKMLVLLCLVPPHRNFEFAPNAQLRGKLYKTIRKSIQRISRKKVILPFRYAI